MNEKNEVTIIGYDELAKYILVFDERMTDREFTDIKDRLRTFMDSDERFLIIGGAKLVKVDEVEE